MKTKWLTWAALAALVAGGVLAADVKPAHKKATPTEIFMRQKLGYSQKVIEGIALENYSLVLTNGEHLWAMTRSNVWGDVHNVTYLDKTSHFQLDVTALLDAARASNTPALIKAYSVVTADCVDCHQTFRRDQFIRTLEQDKK